MFNTAGKINVLRAAPAEFVFLLHGFSLELNTYAKHEMTSIAAGGSSLNSEIIQHHITRKTVCLSALLSFLAPEAITCGGEVGPEKEGSLTVSPSWLIHQLSNELVSLLLPTERDSIYASV